MESSGSDAGATASAAAVEKRRKEEEVVRGLSFYNFISIFWTSGECTIGFGRFPYFKLLSYLLLGIY